jgi:hypothetical protein
MQPLPKLPTGRVDKLAALRDGRVLAIIDDGQLVMFDRALSSSTTLVAEKARGIAVGPGGQFFFYGKGHAVYRGDSDMPMSPHTLVAGHTTEKAHRDGYGHDARFEHISALVVLPGGKVLVSDKYYLRSICLATRQVTTVAGTGWPGTDDGPALEAQFTDVVDMAVVNNTVWAIDALFCAIRCLDGGHVSTLNKTDFGSDDGPIKEATFDYPRAVTTLPDGQVLIADWAIRAVSADHTRVETMTKDGDLTCISAMALLPDHRVLLCSDSKLYVVDGLVAKMPPALKPAAKHGRPGKRGTGPVLKPVAKRPGKRGTGPVLKPAAKRHRTVEPLC